MSEQTASLQEPLVVSDAEVSFEIRRHPNCKVEVLATISPAFSQRHEQIALEQVGKQVSVPGFRKGKVPPTVVKRNFAQQVEGRWHSVLISGLLKKLHEHEHIAPYDRSAKVEYAAKELSIQDGGKVVLSYETGPDFSGVDLTAFEIPQVSITDELMRQAREKAIESTCLFEAGWIETDDAITESHFVDVDVRDIDDETFAEQGYLMQDRRIRVKDAPDHFKAAIIGAKKGDVVRVDASEQEIPSVLVTILQVLLPDLSEALQKAVEHSGLGSEEKLLEHIENMVKPSIEFRIMQEREHAVRSQVGEKLNVEVPMSLVRQEVAHLVSAIVERVFSKDKPPSHEQVDELFKRQLPEAMVNVRLVLLGRQLLKEGKIALKEENLNQMLQAELAEYVKQHGEPDSQEKVDSVINYIRGSVFSKALRRGAVVHIESVGTPVESELKL